MGQVTVLAAATAAGNSTDFTVAAGETWAVGAFATGATISSIFSAVLERKIGSDYQPVSGGDLNPRQTELSVTGPGVYRVRKSVTAQSIGITTDDGL